MVTDTSVLIAALRSRRGASHRLLMLLGSEKFAISVSVPLVLEYEDAAKRLIGTATWSKRGIDDILDYICAIADHQEVFYLWRPFLKDADDDMVLEVAVAAGCDCIVTYNKADFRRAERFGLRIVTAKEFLEEIGELS
ncbi:MAG: PIN domain-containing protein [Anaerolineae bacterium]|nr:PIN domain-containing protein [Anaerolineae bacterium]